MDVQILLRTASCPRNFLSSNAGPNEFGGSSYSRHQGLGALGLLDRDLGGEGPFDLVALCAEGCDGRLVEGGVK